MNEEENNEQQEVKESKLKQAAGRAGKQVAREAERKAKKAIAEALKKAIAKVVAALGAKGLLILAIVLAVIVAVTVVIVAFDDFLDGEVARTADEVTNNAMDEYCTIDEYGVHFDKEKFIETLPKRLKEEVGIDFNDLGLGLIMTDPTGYFFLNPDSQAAQYLYKYMAASLSSELPYIEGSDEETKGIIKIKRKKSDITVETENTKGYIFVGESHVHKLEEALTENDIFVENPSTYVSNSINSKNGEYKYEYGTSGNGTGGNLFFIHTLYDGTEPEYGTSVSNMTQQAFPDWIYNGDSTSNGVRTYQGTATAFERIKKIISSNNNIKNWNVIVMQGYSSALLGQGGWDSYLNNLNSMKSELSKLGGNLYVSSTPHSNAGIWQQDTCYSYGKDSIINNLQGPDSNDNNAIYDQYNQYIQGGFSNFINVTSSSTTNSRGKDGNEYKKYEKKLDSSFYFDNYAHIDINHYDSSTMYAWGEYIINVLDGNVAYTPPASENTNVVQHKAIDTSSYGLSAEEVKITMDNIKNEYKIAWVSDLHMMHPDQPVINTAWYNRQGITFEQRNSVFNNSYLILDNIINCLKGNDFDAIVFGGDIMDNYSDKNLEYLKRRIEGLSGKKVMFLVADHDYLTEMTTNNGVNKSASSIGVSGDIKKITIGKDGDSINLVGQNYSNEQISDSNVSTISSYLNETSNSLFFTHVPVESKTQASSMQEWSKDNHKSNLNKRPEGDIYYWSNNSNIDEYKNPSENYLNTLYNSNSLRGVFAGHVHVTGDFELNTGIKEHIFKASFNNSIGVITIEPSGAGNGSTNQGNINNIDQGNIIQNSNNTEEIELKYIGYQKLQDMINSDDRNVKEESLKYFSLDESWNLCITKWNKESKDDVETSYEVSEVKIPYRNMVSGYAVPFTFLMDLQLVSQNANYVDAVASLMTDQSYIDLTIFDSVTTDETTYTYEATKHTRTRKQGNTIGTGSDYDETTSKEGPDVTVTKIETDSVKAGVTKAKTWIIDQTVTYNLQQDKEYPYEDDEGNEKIKVETRSESKPSGEGSWRDPITETWYEEITKNEWVKGAVETKFMPDEFLGLWSNKTGTYVKGALYTTTKNGGKIVEYNILDGSRKEAPITNIIISKEQLYDLLEQNQTTQTHSEIMKEIINFYLTGDELTDSSFSNFDFISIFEPSEFNGFINFGYGTNTVRDFIHAFEGTPKESNGQYVVFDDGFGNLTVGWGIYIKSHIGKFSARGVDATSLKKGDLVDKAIVDSIEDEILEGNRNTVISITSRIRARGISNRCTYK